MDYAVVHAFHDGFLLYGYYVELALRVGASYGAYYLGAAYFDGSYIFFLAHFVFSGAEGNVYVVFKKNLGITWVSAWLPRAFSGRYAGRSFCHGLCVKSFLFGVYILGIVHKIVGQGSLVGPGGHDLSFEFKRYCIVSVPALVSFL